VCFTILPAVIVSDEIMYRLGVLTGYETLLSLGLHQMNPQSIVASTFWLFGWLLLFDFIRPKCSQPSGRIFRVTRLGDKKQRKEEERKW
jgi:hypothetical protein